MCFSGLFIFRSIQECFGEDLCKETRQNVYSDVYATTSHRQNHFSEKNFYWDNSLQHYEKSYPFNVCTESAEMKENWEPQGCVFSVFSLNKNCFPTFFCQRGKKILFQKLANFNLPLREGVLVTRAVPLLGNREIFLISPFKNIPSRRIRTFGVRSNYLNSF